MTTKFLLLAVVIGLVFAVYARDRYNHKSALQVRTSWNCFRCGVSLGPMQSAFIKVAGGEIGGTTARVCERCARRDRRIWWAGAALLALMFSAVLLLLSA